MAWVGQDTVESEGGRVMACEWKIQWGGTAAIQNDPDLWRENIKGKYRGGNAGFSRLARKIMMKRLPCFARAQALCAQTHKLNRRQLQTSIENGQSLKQGRT